MAPKRGVFYQPFRIFLFLDKRVTSSPRDVTTRRQRTFRPILRPVPTLRLTVTTTQQPPPTTAQRQASATLQRLNTAPTQRLTTASTEPIATTSLSTPDLPRQESPVSTDQQTYNDSGVNPPTDNDNATFINNNNSTYQRNETRETEEADYFRTEELRSAGHDCCNNEMLVCIMCAFLGSMHIF